MTLKLCRSALRLFLKDKISTSLKIIDIFKIRSSQSQHVTDVCRILQKLKVYGRKVNLKCGHFKNFIDNFFYTLKITAVIFVLQPTIYKLFYSGTCTVWTPS